MIVQVFFSALVPLLGVPMAIPPEPLQELLPQAALIVDAEVLEVVSQGEQPPIPEHKKGATSVPSKSPAQVVKLKVKRALKGKAPQGDLTVDKPEGDYVLSKGNKGAFLLKMAKGNPIIIGRYGPDTYRMDTIEAALKAQ